MYVPPLSSWNNQITAPEEYTSRARAKIAQTLHANLNLKYGSSPLKESLNASNLEVDSNNSNDSLPQDIKKHKSFFGSAFKSKKEKLVETESEDVQMIDYNSNRNSSSTLKLNRTTTNSTVQSQASEYSNNQSINSNLPRNVLTQIPTYVSYQTTNDSIFSSNTTADSVNTNITNTSDGTSHQKQYTDQIPRGIPMVTIQDIIPKDFNDMYSPELLKDKSTLINGRPSFTKRDLIDWELNDIRSLLIIEELKAEWNGQVPIIYNPIGFKVQYLPITSNDELIIKVLVESDIYKESKFDINFRLQTAQYTIKSARLRHRQFLKTSHLTKPEWRNIIENFLLNLAVESQCRHDFKKNCNLYKREKLRTNQSSFPNGLQNSVSSKNHLLKKALLNGVSKSNDKLTKDEKSSIWINTQSEVYKRVGLDWAPDNL